MNKWFFILLLVGVVSLFSAELDEIITDRPVPTELSRMERKILIFYLEHLGPHFPEYYYRIASFYIQTGELQKAKESLKSALEVDPHFLLAITQLGFIYLWEKEWKRADENFKKAWNLAPCDVNVAKGLIYVGLYDKKNVRAKEIAKQVEGCSWKDPDVLLYLGILDTHLHRWKEAEASLKKSLKLSPHYKDAFLQLANLYSLENKQEEATSIYNRYPEDLESLKGFGRLAEKNENYAFAEKYYREALEQQPEDVEARKGLAQVLSAQLKYTEAKEQYAILLRKQGFDPGKFSSIPPRRDEENWIRSMDVKSHTNCAFLQELDYTDAKESDPSLRVPVVKDYYFTEKFTFFIPIFDRWRLGAQQFYYHQRENNILEPSTNYSAFLNGGALNSHYFFAKDWEWDISLKGVHARGIQDANYPFKSSTLFEPATRLMYNGDWNLFILNGSVKDQIIKNFPLTISQLLRIDAYEGIYGLHPPIYLRPNIEVGLGQSFYHDSIHNWKQHQQARAEIDLHFKELRLSYLFEHGKFKKLTENYFSYKNQIQHTLSLKWTQNLSSKTQLELLWDHVWQLNHKLILPVGNLIFVAQKLYLIGNRYTGLVRYRFRDRLVAEISGHYFMLTLPYHDWNVRGSLLWQF